jgi:hypothetical protein
MNLVNRPAVLLFSVILLLIGTPKAMLADTVIFKDFPPGDFCCNVDGWLVAGPSGTPYSSQTANGFTSSGNYSVSQIDIGISSFLGTNSAIVELTTDSGGFPGTVLGSWNISNQSSSSGNCCPITAISGITGVNISAGNYFLVALPGASDTFDLWNINITGIRGLVEGNQNGAGFEAGPVEESTLGAFAVIGTPSIATPEPGTLLLLGTGLLFTRVYRRRQQALGDRNA